MKATAVFLDRDGTIIENPGYIKDPRQVRLFPDAAEAIRRFSATGHLVIVVSNQSGVARGLITEEDLQRVHQRMEELLRAQGARVDGAYYCPFLDGPEAVVETFRRDSALRKPRPGMILRAAEERGIDLAESWMIGDSPSDVEAGRRAGCRTILLNRSSNASTNEGIGAPVVPTLIHALPLIEQATLQAGRDGSTANTNNETQVDDTLKGAVQTLSRVAERLNRPFDSQRQDDFSMYRLLGAILQMLAIVSAIWGVGGILAGQAEAAVPRLLLACFLQLTSLSAYLADRFR